MIGNNTFIIGEIGISANGDINIAKKLIKGAKECGADAVKFQKRSIFKVYSKEELNKSRESPWGTSFRDQKLGLEFNQKEYDEIDKYSKEINIEWFASSWDLESLAFLKQYDLSYMKIPSPLLIHDKLLEEIAKYGKYTFISTGMSTIEEIGNAVNIFRKYECLFELMHCNSVYPTPDIELNLKCIETLKNIFQCRVGYSGHSPGIMDGVLAVALGATSVEKHITLNRTMYGSDQPSSLELHGFAKMIEYIKFTEEALGTGDKIITPKELIIKQKLRRNQDYEE